MSTTTTAFQIAEGAEPLAGYVLNERIGVGGYGEVWKATAAGGLHKAVKFIFGRFDDERAASEARSLDRVKELTHPFLLTLERIECVGDHLAIVTELAEESLRERFDRCQESKLPGIPREELLRYLSEAADALDYLTQRHALQHLDVKPENLLLLGNHVKVADFGLLKNLQEMTASLVSGLTPRYASPEVFDGRPTMYSDQYSLAVVYKEMLTGELPFNGKTAATLASQHLHCDPDLSGLTPLERFAVGKALAKDPVRRFSSCSEFVKRLSHRNRAVSSTDRVGAHLDNTSPLVTKNAASPETNHLFSHANGLPPERLHDGQTVIVSTPESRALPALDLDSAKPVYRPTVLVGLGGAGGRVLCRFRQLLADRFGDGAATESLRLLYTDTDVDSVNAATSDATGRGALRGHEALAVPLRDSWDYRKRTVGSLDSVSRRWIYNIPRSRQTEGLRALGRLAMLDHSDRVLRALRSALLAATDSESIRTTAECTGLPFQELDPRVFLIASLGGGAGGGMLLDMAYAVRQVLAETGFSDDGLCGILLCSLARGNQKRALAPANVLACLEELKYFSLPGNDFPGEPACGLSSFRQDGPTFESTYLIGSTDEYRSDIFRHTVEEAASYLSMSCISPASAFLDTCRESTYERYEENPLCLRSTGSATLGAENSSIRPEWVEHLCNLLVRQWLGNPNTSAENAPIRLTEQQRLSEACHAAGQRSVQPDELEIPCLKKISLDPEHLVSDLRRMLQQELGCDVESYLYKVASNSVGGVITQNESTVLLALRTLHSLVGIEDESDTELSRQIESLRDRVTPVVSESAGSIGAALESWVLELVNDPNTRISGARRAIEYIASHSLAQHDDAQNRRRRTTDERAGLREHILEVCRDPKSKRRDLEADCRRYVELLVEEFTRDSACRALGGIRPFVTSCADRLRDLWKEIGRLANEFATRESVEPGDDETAEVDARHSGLTLPMSAIVAEHETEMLEALDREVDSTFLERGQTLHCILTMSDGQRAELVDRIRAAARKAILKCANKVTMSRVQRELLEGDTSQICASLQRHAEAALPQLVKAGGGGRRLLLVVPKSMETSRLKEAVQQASEDVASVVCDDESEIRLCYEVEALSAEGIKARLVRSRPDCEEIVHRLHTRIDVDW